jgi:hypothetical protein
MSGWQMMVVLIVAIVMFTAMVRGKSSSGRRGRHAGPGADVENERLRDELAELKQRLAVLERITVEKENSLERQIESLRKK